MPVVGAQIEPAGFSGLLERLQAQQFGGELAPLGEVGDAEHGVAQFCHGAHGALPSLLDRWLRQVRHGTPLGRRRKCLLCVPPPA